MQSRWDRGLIYVRRVFLEFRPSRRPSPLSRRRLLHSHPHQIETREENPSPHLHPHQHRVEDKEISARDNELQKQKNRLLNSILLQPCRRGNDYRRRSLETPQGCAKMWVKSEGLCDWSYSILTGSDTTSYVCLSESISEVASNLKAVLFSAQWTRSRRQGDNLHHSFPCLRGGRVLRAVETDSSATGSGRGSHFICCFCSEHRDIRRIQ